MIFETLDTYGHEQVVFCHNKDAGLKAIIAIHNTVLGPALGGTRMWPYKSEAEALNDVLRLSRGMTYKNAVAGLNIGGGKAVIIGDPATDKSEALFRAFGQFVESLGGRYITAEDVGIDVNDMEYVYRETQFVTGVHQVHGGSGDPSPFTAYGTLQGLLAALNRKFGNEDVGNYSYAVQGLGHVGIEFVKLLKERGAKIFVTDINKERVERAVSEYGAEAVGLDAHVRDADIVVTGEGRIDGQTAFGKTPVGVARVAKRHNKPVIAIGGSLRADVDAVFAHGIDAVSSVLYRPCTIDEALTEGNENLRRAARNIAAILSMGLGIGASGAGK